MEQPCYTAYTAFVPQPMFVLLTVYPRLITRLIGSKQEKQFAAAPPCIVAHSAAFRFLCCGFQGGRLSYLRSIFCARQTWGSLVCIRPCGVVCGVQPIWEAEGMVEVDRALNAAFPEENSRPQLVFYDRACQRRRYLVGRGDTTWAGTSWVVDRFDEVFDAVVT